MVGPGGMGIRFGPAARFGRPEGELPARKPIIYREPVGISRNLIEISGGRTNERPDGETGRAGFVFRRAGWVDERGPAPRPAHRRGGRPVCGDFVSRWTKEWNAGPMRTSSGGQKFLMGAGGFAEIPSPAGRRNGMRVTGPRVPAPKSRWPPPPRRPARPWIPEFQGPGEG